jgi:hypothetical protein
MEFLSESSSQPEPARQPARTVTAEEALHLYLRSKPKPELEAMLRCVQLRLGTAAERHDDMVTAQAIAHQLNNLRTCEELGDEVAKLGSA